MSHLSKKKVSGDKEGALLRAPGRPLVNCFVAALLAMAMIWVVSLGGLVKGACGVKAEKWEKLRAYFATFLAHRWYNRGVEKPVLPKATKGFSITITILCHTREEYLLTLRLAI